MASTESRVMLRLALDPGHWRRHDKLNWAMTLVDVTQAAAPSVLRVESYEISDTIVNIRLRSSEQPKRLKKLLRDHDGLMRLHSRFADLGARPDFEIEGE